MRREPLAAEIRFAELVALDHRAHRAVEDENALGEKRRSSICRVVHECVTLGSFLVPGGNQHRERIAGAARADAHGRRRRSPASAMQSPAAAVVAEAEPAIAELRAHPRLVVLAQVEDEHAAAGPQDAVRFGERARPDCSA